jgi:hypothetical protein
MTGENASSSPHASPAATSRAVGSRTRRELGRLGVDPAAGEVGSWGGSVVRQAGEPRLPGANPAADEPTIWGGCHAAKSI